MKKILVLGIAMAFTAPVFAQQQNAPHSSQQSVSNNTQQHQGSGSHFSQQGPSLSPAGDQAPGYSSVNDHSSSHGSRPGAGALYAMGGDRSSGRHDAGSGGTGGTCGTAGTGGTGGTAGTGGTGG